MTRVKSHPMNTKQLTMNCTKSAIELNDRDGAMRRNGVDFSRLPVTSEWQWRSTCTEVRSAGGRLEVREHGGFMRFGPRTLSHALRNPSAPLSHAAMLDSILGN